MLHLVPNGFLNALTKQGWDSFEAREAPTAQFQGSSWSQLLTSTKRNMIGTSGDSAHTASDMCT